MQIVDKNIKDKEITETIVEFVSWLQSCTSVVVSVRDVLAWVHFINTVTTQAELVTEF